MVSGKTFQRSIHTWRRLCTLVNWYFIKVFTLMYNSYTATSFGAQSNYWEDFVDGIDFVGDWVSGLDYGEGALVKYSGNVYLCESAQCWIPN